MRTQLGRFSDEQIERAKAVDILDYARSQGLHLKKAGNSYRVLDKEGGFWITPSKNVWNWFDNHTGGGVIQLCMELENKTWLEAVKTLLGEEMEVIRHASDWKPEPEPPKEFHLPDKNYTYSHVFAYLTKTRGIDEGIVKDMVARKLIYENTKRSCVFVGRDKEGVAKHASVRSTNTYGKVFKQDITGSQKAFSFSISGTSGTLNVLEAPIDVLSYMSLQKMYGKKINDSYLALGGVSDRALEQYLEDYKDIQKIRICTDNDPCLNPSWDAEDKSDVIMHLEKGNMVKELDDSFLFRTYGDYSQFVQHMGDNVKYIAFSKNDLTLSEDGKLYSISINAEQEYMLYESVNSYYKGTGMKVTGHQLYSQHFFKMPAGEKAAYLINEKYKQNYKITRHRPTHKDFNEDLMALKYPERTKEEEQDIEKENVQTQNSTEQTQQTASENIEQMKAENSMILQQAGISQKVIDWYQGQQDTMPLSAENFQIKGTSSILFVCENPVEVFSVMEMRMLIYQSRYGKDDYVSNDNYLVYSDMQQFNQYMQEHPDIEDICLCGGKTAGGQRLNKEIAEGINGDKRVIPCEPETNTYAELLALKKAVVEVMEQTPMNDQQSLEELDMVAEM